MLLGCPPGRPGAEVASGPFAVRALLGRNVATGHSHAWVHGCKIQQINQGFFNAVAASTHRLLQGGGPLTMW